MPLVRQFRRLREVQGTDLTSTDRAHVSLCFLAIFTGGWLLFSAIAWFTTIRHEKTRTRNSRKNLD